jgi:predicted PurR-regulated permease PerM
VDRNPTDDDGVTGIDARELSGVFATPGWLRDAGVTAWLLIGLVLLVVAVVGVLGLTYTIVAPVVTATVIAAVAAPLVRWLAAHHVPRGIGAILVLLGLVAVVVLVVFMVLGGITSQAGNVKAYLTDARGTIEGWARDAGIDSSTASNANAKAGSSTTDAAKTLLDGVATGIRVLSSLVIFLSFTALSLIFLLKDGPTIRAWVERHAGVPASVARTVSGRVLQSLRGYFFGVTIVAVFNSVLVGGGALLLGVPLAGTIAVVTFFGAYIPYIGAWSAGALSVLVALGGAGTDAALAMIVIQLLANGVLQQLVQPIAYGAALGIHPLAVLIVTIAGGALFGAVGLILAAPLTSAVTRISSDLAEARTA